MHSIRTSIPLSDKNLFKSFLEYNDMQYVIIGDFTEAIDRYNRYKDRRYICYAYSDINTEAIANLTFIKLKYGSVEQAYKEYINEIMSMDIHTN
jgi:hypothetical protein